MTFIPEKDIFLTPFNEQAIVERDLIISFEPLGHNSISTLRDLSILTGTAGISGSLSEILVNTGPTANSNACLETKRRGRYYSGFMANAGIGIRIPVTASQTQEVKWGYYDDVDGFGFGQDELGSFIFVRASGSTRKQVYQSSWNVDTLNGSGASGLTLDYSFGAVTNIVYTWYGYGAIDFYILARKSNNEKKRIKVHSEIFTGSTSVNNTSLPLRVEILNGASGSNFESYVGGRQYSIFGTHTDAEIRRVATSSGPITLTDNFQNILTIKKKDTFNGAVNAIEVILSEIELQVDNPVEYELFYCLSGTLSASAGGPWTSPEGTLATETCVETIVTGSYPTATLIKIDNGFLSADRNKVLSEKIVSNSPLGTGDYFVLTAKRTSAVATIARSILKWDEKW